MKASFTYVTSVSINAGKSNATCTTVANRACIPGGNKEDSFGT